MRRAAEERHDKKECNNGDPKETQTDYDDLRKTIFAFGRCILRRQLRHLKIKLAFISFIIGCDSLGRNLGSSIIRIDALPFYLKKSSGWEKFFLARVSARCRFNHRRRVFDAFCFRAGFAHAPAIYRDALATVRSGLSVS